jgi:hypothetical protein
MIIRPEASDEVAATGAVVAAAFGDEPIEELVEALRASSAWRDLSYVAELDGRVVGHVSFTRGWLDAPSRLVEVLVLSPLSVHPDHQGAGASARRWYAGRWSCCGNDPSRWCSWKAPRATTADWASARACPTVSPHPPPGSRLPRSSSSRSRRTSRG